jgi:hypothetical protein
MSEITGGDIAAVASELSGSGPSAPDASPASDPGSVDRSTPAPTAATVPSSDTPPDISTDPASAGPIPFDRHKSALENARTKAREEALTEWRSQHGWAEQVPREQFESFSQTAQQMASDPVGFLQRFANELQNHPVYGPQLKSQAARTLGQRQAAQQNDAEPQPDLETEAGEAVFSAKRQQEWRAWHDRQLEKKFDERLAPLQETHAQVQEARQRELIDHASGQFASQQLATIKALPGYTEHAAEIKAEFAKMPPPDHPMGYAVQLRDAWIKVVVPKLDQTSRAKALAEMNAKGLASTASPTRPSASAPLPDSKRPLADILAEEAQRAGIGR